ncbi:CPBP family intramembrane glutamic endopeptidase [[Limnothrix rosea] IAM M-220]|uniref:CPBP family intramembrane glutamic endopeptidase n=1 Tax=[Limnothrix rosea] IAM M-220 TaxID=454133 RepID=UPI00095B17DA|nr:CPBP family intramembrane glutamic endopeptidase [[Limnothrix rosea] IAM M-220]OKH13458.1 abortive phage infection protein [[Limnothrix rosea] IAM M-220]
MGITALLLFIVGNLWRMIGNVALLPWEITPTAFLQGGAIAAGIIMMSSILYALWEDYRQSVNTYLEFVLKPLALPDVVWLGLLPGLSEEFLFRGIMLPGLGFGWIALVFSSALFGVLHISGAQQWSYAVWATVIGFVLGFSAIATGNLFVPVIAHIITNLTSSFIWKIRNPMTTSQK